MNPDKNGTGQSEKEFLASVSVCSCPKSVSIGVHPWLFSFGCGCAALCLLAASQIRVYPGSSVVKPFSLPPCRDLKVVNKYYCQKM
jgi:hypothetical protein